MSDEVEAARELYEIATGGCGGVSEVELTRALSNVLTAYDAVAGERDRLDGLAQATFADIRTEALREAATRMKAKLIEAVPATVEKIKPYFDPWRINMGRVADEVADIIRVELESIQLEGE